MWKTDFVLYKERIMKVLLIIHELDMKGLHMVAWILLFIGGLKWGLSVFGWDLAAWGLPSGLLSVVYVLVGLAALFDLFTHKSSCKHCSAGGSMPTGSM